MNDPEMPDDAVIPHVGMGCGNGEMIRLGMSKDEAAYLLGDNMTISVDYRGDPPKVAFIQASKWWGNYEGIEVFEESADGVVADIVRLHDLDAEVYGPQKHTYYFPDLNMILWRDTTSTEDGDQGYIFDCVSLHTEDYYSKETIASYRERMGLPPL
jgi:hypothetical protein